MVKRNPHFAELPPTYLFAKLQREVTRFKSENPEVQLINLGIGDTTEPIPPTITEGLKQAAHQLGTPEGYKGYGPEAGNPSLRHQIAEILYQNKISGDEIFISDGAKCDVGRLQLLFGSRISIAVQDPTYPVYVDTSRLLGQQKIVYLPCKKEHGFFPRLDPFPNVDLIYLCFPNNPTGSVATFAQLKALVNLARKHQTLIIYDTAYAGYIQDLSLPRTIYEIEGAHEVAIEVSSFSKLAGFTGVRLGWSVVPHALKYEEGSSIQSDWRRIITTFFNGPSNIAQAGGLLALSKEGLAETQHLIRFYLENASLLKKALRSKKLPVYGGEHIPYLWVYFGHNEAWSLLLQNTHLITTPGAGFGPAGEGFLRFSAFSPREQINQAIEKIEKRWPDAL
ncbi:MAG: LL-diaminopimelate aminotransferase [Chlamydiales bacterium]